MAERAAAAKEAAAKAAATVHVAAEEVAEVTPIDVLGAKQPIHGRAETLLGLSSEYLRSVAEVRCNPSSSAPLHPILRPLL
jgi:hypothetical protein